MGDSPPARKPSQKAYDLLGTTPSKISMMKKLGVSAEELEAAVAESEVASVEAYRREADARIMSNPALRGSPKCLNQLGYDPSHPRLMKQLGLTLEELEEAIAQGKVSREEFLNDCQKALMDMALSANPVNISSSEKSAIVESEKLQKILGVAPRDVRVMKILGIDEDQLREYLALQNDRTQEPPQS